METQRIEMERAREQETAVPYKVRILLIDSDKQFREQFCSLVSSILKDAPYQIDIDDGFRLTANIDSNHSINHDIYICGAVDNSVNIIEAIKAIKLKDPNGSIFVVPAPDTDSSLLKKILKLNVVGLVDRDSMDASEIIGEIMSVQEAYEKVRNMVEKLNRLSSLKSVG